MAWWHGCWILEYTKIWRIMNAIRIQEFNDINERMMCYFEKDGIWYLYVPECGLSNLMKHEVTEHRDGTITVTPSIRVFGHKDGKPTEVHGYLEAGQWRAC